MLSEDNAEAQRFDIKITIKQLVQKCANNLAVSGAEPEYYDFIGEQENRPIINFSPLDGGDIEQKLEWIVANKSRLPELSRRSVEFVAKHNDSRVVAQRHLKYLSEIVKP